MDNNTKTIIISVSSFFAGALLGGASVYFYLTHKNKKVETEIEDIEDVEDNVQIEKNNLPNILKEDADKFNKEFNEEKVVNPTKFNNNDHVIKSIFDKDMQVPQDKKGPEVKFHPEDKPLEEVYPYPKEQDINEGAEETIDYLNEKVYDAELDSDLIMTNEDGSMVWPYTINLRDYEYIYEHDNEYDKEILYWYEGNKILVRNDRHITNNPKTEEIISDEGAILHVIGDANERFGENPNDEDTVYVKNNEMHMLYELRRLEEPYRGPHR